jgi:hypothetical protein
MQAAAYASVALMWAMVHPGVRALIAGGANARTSGFTGILHPEVWGQNLIRYILALVNVPPPGFAFSWPTRQIGYGLIAAVIMVAGLLWREHDQEEQAPPAPISLRRIAVIAILLGVPTLLAPTVLIGHWASYFACFPALGLATFAGAFLARQKTQTALAALVIFLGLGVAYRGSYAAQEAAWTEKVFVEASDAAKVVRQNFLKLFPRFPPGSQVLISVSSTGVRGIQSTMIEGQALQIWYGDPTIRTVPTLKRQVTGGPEYLVRITPDLDVLAIDPNTGVIRSDSPNLPEISEIARPLVSYARAVAAGGDVDRAVRLMNSLAQTRDEVSRAYYRRMSASFLLGAARRPEAQQVLAGAQAFSREASLKFVKRLLAEPTESEALDESSFEAFGLSGSDPGTIRWLMQELRKTDSIGQAAWYAIRLQKLVPGDAESQSVIRAALKGGIKPSRMPM